MGKKTNNSVYPLPIGTILYEESTNWNGIVLSHEECDLYFPYGGNSLYYAALREEGKYISLLKKQIYRIFVSRESSTFKILGEDKAPYQPNMGTIHDNDVFLLHEGVAIRLIGENCFLEVMYGMKHMPFVNRYGNPPNSSFQVTDPRQKIDILLQVMSLVKCGMLDWKFKDGILKSKRHTMDYLIGDLDGRYDMSQIVAKKALSLMNEYPNEFLEVLSDKHKKYRDITQELKILYYSR